MYIRMLSLSGLSQYLVVKMPFSYDVQLSKRIGNFCYLQDIDDFELMLRLRVRVDPAPLSGNDLASVRAPTAIART